MTTRLIETCFDMEDAEEIFRHTWFYLFDPSLISRKEIMELQNAKPGQFIRMRRKGRWGHVNRNPQS